MPDQPVTLAKGSHDPDETDDCGNPRRCLFEWYNWLTRQQHTDNCPPGVSRVLHEFGMRLNDCLPDAGRQQLARYLPNGTDRLADTAGDGRDPARSYMALDWLVRVFVPAWFDLVPSLAGHASALRGLSRLDGPVSCDPARPVLDAARDAAWDAARDAAWAAARDAARDAAGDAAGDAARDAARDAAGDAAGDAAWAAARDAAWAAAGDAAWAAAGDAAGDAAWAAARDAARDKLRPVVVILQESALVLYDQMITGAWPDA